MACQFPVAGSSQQDSAEILGRNSFSRFHAVVDCSFNKLSNLELRGSPKDSFVKLDKSGDDWQCVADRNQWAVVEQQNTLLAVVESGRKHNVDISKKRIVEMLIDGVHVARYAYLATWLRPDMRYSVYYRLSTLVVTNRSQHDVKENLVDVCELTAVRNMGCGLRIVQSSHTGWKFVASGLSSTAEEEREAEYTEGWRLPVGVRVME